MPKFLLINWKLGTVAGGGTENECRAQLQKISEGSSAAKGDSYIIAEVKVVSMNRIYEGGHHTVWCDSNIHQRTEGGYVWPLKPYAESRKMGEPFECDCAFWKSFKESITA